MFCCAAPQRQSSGGKPKPGPRIEERGRSPSPQDLRPLRLELEPEPEPEPAPAQQPQHRSPLQPAPGSPLEPEGEAAANELPEPYSGPFTPGRHCMRYVRLLLAHVVFSLVLGALASRRGTFFSGRFPYSQPRDSEEASHGEKGAALMSDVWAWALSRVGLFADLNGGSQWELMLGWQRMFGSDVATWVCILVCAHILVRVLGRTVGRGWLVYETEIREIAVGPQANTTVALAQLAARDRTHSGAGLPGSPARGTAGLEHSGKLHVSSSGAVAAGSGGAGGGAVQEKPSGRERLSVPRQNWQRVLSAVMQRAAASQHRQGCVHNIGKPAPFSNPFLEGECYFRTSTSPHENDRRYFHGKKRMIDIQFKLRYKYKPEGFLYCGFEGTGGTTPAWSWGTRFAVKIARKIVAIRHPEFISEWGENITPICMLAYDTFWDTFFMDRGQDAGDGTGRRIYPDSPPLAGPANPMPTNRSHKQILDGEAEIDVGTQFTMSFYSQYMDLDDWVTCNNPSGRVDMSSIITNHPLRFFIEERIAVGGGSSPGGRSPRPGDGVRYESRRVFSMLLWSRARPSQVGGRGEGTALVMLDDRDCDYEDV